MSNVSSTALSGMKAAQTQLNVAANNVANAQTPGFRRQQAEMTAQPDGGVQARVTTGPREGPALETDLVAQLQAKNAFLANLAVFKTSDRMAGALFDDKA